MHNYRGKYPNKIKSVSSNGMGFCVVVTNCGQRFKILARSVSGVLPKLGEDISKYDGKAFLLN